MTAVRDGWIELDGPDRRVRWWLHGEADETLMIVHGGPGAGSEYLRPIAEVAGDGVQVLLYDQLGAGESDRPDDPSSWTLERSVDEVEQVRSELGLGPVHLLGQSYGGFVALEHVLRHREAVRSLILSNTAASVPEIVRHMTRLRGALDERSFATLLRHEAAGTLEDDGYQAVVRTLYARHLRRTHPFDLERSEAEYAELIAPLLADLGPAYVEMWGHNEFLPTGNLITWDVRQRLGEIVTPTLILCGLHDELGVPLHEDMARQIPDNEFLIFGNSSHLPFREQDADAYLDAIRSFLRRIIDRQRPSA